MELTERSRPLEGIRVLELGQLIAGPFTGSVLGYFGAEVIKIEPAGRGDPIRGWREVRNGTSLWWHSVARNKKSVTLDLRHPRGRELAGRLAEVSDVLVENFRPGTMERWGLGPDELRERNPGLVYARISGYGQTGPYASRPGFASVCEGIGGFRHLNGHPGEPPVRPNLSLGDTLAALHAVVGVLLSLMRRERLSGLPGDGAGGRAPGTGQVVDVAIYEAVFNMLESVVPEYDGAGIVRQPSGSTLTGIAPTNTYPCEGGRFVIIGGNNDSIYRRLMAAIGRGDLAEDPRMAGNAGRVQYQHELDEAISAWTRTRTVEQVLEAMERAEVPAGPIYDAADMAADPHFQARGLFETVEVDGAPLKIPAIAPLLSETPGATQWPGPALGAHNREVLVDLLGLAEGEVEDLARSGVI